LGLPADALEYFNDDRVGRCLDTLFRADRATLMTEIVVHAVQIYVLAAAQGRPGTESFACSALGCLSNFP
jgi:hypothetical protein